MRRKFLKVFATSFFSFLIIPFKFTYSKTKKIKSKLEGELKLAILKKAALYERDDFKKYYEETGKKKAKTFDKKN